MRRAQFVILYSESEIEPRGELLINQALLGELLAEGEFIGVDDQFFISVTMPPSGPTFGLVQVDEETEVAVLSG